MLFLKKIILTQFKNYEEAQFDFTKNVVAISGRNGVGKTNLLDAIFYLCFTKSYFHHTDNYAIQFGKQGLRLQGVFENNDEILNVVCINRGSGKKEIMVNDLVYEKFSAHIGRIPCVIITPDDVELITGASDERRKFLDTMISQWDEHYLQDLIKYQKILTQRNSLLKSYAETTQPDYALLDVLNMQLIKPAQTIFEGRKKYLQEFIPMVQYYYGAIAKQQESIELRYESQLEDADFLKLLLANKQKDLILQRTNAGVHKDDFSILLNRQMFKNCASQGQRKSLLFALKLAEFEILKIKKGFSPILLLDDLFEKLDEQRMNNLLEIVCKQTGSQLFITDTNRERLNLALDRLKINYQLLQLEANSEPII